ncbi:pilin [Alicyclobacillus hesperidum]|nr:pilin [Alicyclobacillus hesperidum]
MKDWIRQAGKGLYTCGVALVSTAMTAEADTSGINNPLSSSSSSVSSVLNQALGWLDDAIFAVAGALFLFHLYKAIIGLMAGSHHAQRREEAKSHLIWVAISGVMLGGGAILAGALYNLGKSF